jgi:hypothetical protein
MHSLKREPELQHCEIPFYFPWFDLCRKNAAGHLPYVYFILFHKVLMVSEYLTHMPVSRPRCSHAKC